MTKRKKAYQVIMDGADKSPLMRVRIPYGRADLTLGEIQEKMKVPFEVKLFAKNDIEATAINHVMVIEQYVME